MVYFTLKINVMRQYIFLISIIMALFGHLPLWGQSTCGPAQAVDTGGYATSLFFNYGSKARINTSKNRMAIAVGQTFTGYVENAERNTSLGFYSRFLLPPFALVLKATQGDLLDRIQLSWETDALGPDASDGFNIYRDGVFLATVNNNIRTYNDFNVIAGVAYRYEVRGLNLYGEGAAGRAIGFQVPNGVVTGWVRTLNDRPVPDALITLTPLQGFSALFAPGNGGLALAEEGTDKNFLPTTTKEWSLAFWVRTDASTPDGTILSLQPAGLTVFHSTNANSQAGIRLEIASPVGGTVVLNGSFADGTQNDWHHVAFTADAVGQGRLYLDGQLVAIDAIPALAAAEMLQLGTEAKAQNTWSGRLDELRMYHRRLDELDLGEAMMGTASSQTLGLKYYWKMDEELGTNSFDVLRRHKLYLCGAKFDKDRPPVRTMGKTDENGFYRIESASYGTGTTFLAKPNKDFYRHRALKLVRSEGDYATLPNFALPPKATLELWANSAGPDGEQCLLSKKWGSNEMRLLLSPNGTDNDVKMWFNGTEHSFGLLGMRYQHLAFAIDSSGDNRIVSAYKNGQPFGQPFTFSGISGNGSDSTQQWILGARLDGTVPGDFFGGLLDEIAVYDTILSQTAIAAHVQQSRDPRERGLKIYFALDEGNGNRLNNLGSVLTGSGRSVGAEWTPQAANQSTTPHEFAPGTRQVTLNPSVTSVDQVDFTDRSTVAVSGFVRYKNTDCFANRVEILVNGASYNPQIFTDSTGQFIVDFEPGTTAVLTPKFENHQFAPASWELTNVNSPIAGILFNDVTTRKIKGQIAGGLCRKPIISGAAEDCRVTVRTKDGCFEWTKVITEPDGKYEFDPLPPLELTIAISKHNNPTIYKDFQKQGGRTINLTQKDSTGVDFIYIAPPSVGVQGLEDYFTDCKGPNGQTLTDADGNPLIILEEFQTVKLDVTVFEQYGPGQNPDDRCLLDSAYLSIDNTFDLKYDFLAQKEDTLRNKKYDYDFIAAFPSPDPPYLKIMQITATANGRTGVFTRRALITGIIKGTNKFTTVSPMVPNFILRDPPGDGSFSFMEKGETICNTLSTENGGGGGPFFTLDALGGSKLELNIPFAPKQAVEALAGVTSEFSLNIVRTNSTSVEYCLTTNERISTDDGDLVVGDKTSLDGGKTILAGNDVYVGTAFNFIFSDSKFVRFNDTTCSVQVKDVTTIQSDTFATTYMYSEYNLENNVIRYLDSLIVDGQDPNGINSTAKKRWLDFIALNKTAKTKAKFKKNLTWDAGIQYEYSETRDTAQQVESSLSESFEGLLGFALSTGATGAATGQVELKTGAKFEGSFNQGTGQLTQRGTTVGYVLKDDDPLDTWTMDVKDDPLFKTPVFHVRAGQTSCPWEVGTSQREGVKLLSVDGNTRLNVPSNGIAAFNFLLTNTSPTGETWTYGVTAGPESNANGAIVKLNGAALDHNVLFAIPWGEQIPITITVERGPQAYTYEGLEVVLFSLCHDARANGLGIAPDNDPYLYSAVYLNVYFDEPCSEVDIAFPQQGWVVKPDAINPATQNLLPVTISGYDKTDADLVGIRLQYRPSDGNGAWINITEGVPDYIPKDSLGDVFEVFNWNTDGTPPLADGDYEIRAVTICENGPTDKPGYSHVIKGRIERQPPSLIGTPEPADGVFHVGDEISFTFNKDINCNKIIEADLTQPNNVGLYDAVTDQLIDVDVTCRDNKIILVPKFQNAFFENRVLRAEIRGIQDKIGNKQVYDEWEFYVDRNELAWLTDSLGMTKFEDDTRTVTANIQNQGGSPINFSIQGVPSWARVVPNKGSLAPNEVRPIRFEVDSSLAFGHWRDTVILRTETGQNPFFMGGDEALPIGVRVVCRPPNWDLDAGIFENSMNMILQFDIQGEMSTDEEDIVAAYMNDTLVGRAKLQYEPQLQKHIAYLTIYGSPYHKLKPLKLEIWDASACLRYDVKESFDFLSDAVVGNPKTPVVIHTNSLVLREIPLGIGWNWISFNLDFPDPAINTVFSSLNDPKNGLIRSQTLFSSHHNPSGTWIGSLTELADSTMYVYKANSADTLKVAGNVINPANRPIPIKTGWNWIGYIPNYALPVNRALSSLPSEEGDLIKSQSAFAQYINPTFGWVGNLKFMAPLQGYQLKAAKIGSLIYPPNLGNGQDPNENILDRGKPETSLMAFWTVNPSLFERSMTLIGMLKVGDQNATAAGMELGVFAGNELRGATPAIWAEPLKAYLFFLTAYANTNGELLQCKLYEAGTAKVSDLSEKLTFIADLHQGSLEMPLPFSFPTSSSGQAIQADEAFEVQPNPFSNTVELRFALPVAQDISLLVYDVNGRSVAHYQQTASAGPNILRWDGRNEGGQPLPNGVYVAKLHTASGTVTRKLVLQR